MTTARRLVPGTPWDRALDAAVHLGAVVARNDDDCRRQVNEAAVSVHPLSLAGRTVTVKDWIDVDGFPCEGESAERTDRRPARDATAVARLRAAGAVVVAKTQPGAIHPIHGECHHPLDLARTPGGSSSGEAALIGFGASSLGLGSDSGGSIRLPAAWCGVFGFKPSYGLVPVTGHFPRVGDRHDGRTVIGPMANTVDDIVVALRVIVGPDGVDPSCVPVELGEPTQVDMRRLRIATIDPESWPVAASTANAVEAALHVLVDHGATVMDDPLANHLDESLDITQRYWTRHVLSGADVDRQLRDWDRFNGWITRASSAFDVVVGPVVANVAPLKRPLNGDDYVFTLPWSLVGWPAISIPMGADAATGLPLAVQVAAPRFHDHVVLAIAALLASSQF